MTNAILLAALYLRGGPRVVEARRASWPEVLKALRRSECGPEDAPEALRKAGFWAEALLLESPGLIDWAVGRTECGLVLSAIDGDYPWRWIRVLGPSAPPVLWRLGELPSLPTISVVGSRRVSSATRKFCESIGREASKLGFAVVSGGAEGCDQAAAKGAEQAIEILPYGIDLARPSKRCLLSVCPPGEGFSTAAAMERNALIYAASSHTVIGETRYREGGTWHGAVHAARSRLGALIVRRSESKAMRALVAIGGAWIDRPSDLAAALKHFGPQRELFESAV